MMTILVMGTIQLKAGDGARVAQQLAEHATIVRTEDGCEDYSFAFDAGDRDLVRLAERWTSAAALAAHFEQPHQKTFGALIRTTAPMSLAVDAWDGAHWRKLM